MDAFEPRAVAPQRPLDDALQLGQPALFSAAAGADAALLRCRAATRALSPIVIGSRGRGSMPTLLALHGLNGSSDAHYMRGLAAKAFARGMNVVRLNQRNCGDTEHLSEGLFHSGLTADAAHVVHELTAVDGLPAIAVAGYSLGGNLALKLAGEYGAHAAGDARRRRRRVADHRDQRVHARARTAGQRAVSVEFRAAT